MGGEFANGPPPMPRRAHAQKIFSRICVSQDNAIPLAGTVVVAERDGSLSHGLLRLPGYVATLKSGWGGRPSCAGGYRCRTGTGRGRRR
jgi:hypothetical protein